MLNAARTILNLGAEQLQWCIDNSNDINSWNKVIITVPHSLCLEEDSAGHWCDYSALEFAELLGTRLGAQIIPAITSRRLCDLNRVLCPELRILEQYLSMIDLVDGTLILDIHSYPASYYLYGPYEVVLLDPKSGYTSYVKDLGRFLSNNGINVAIMQGSIINNIVVSAMLLNSPCMNNKLSTSGILFEINEALTSVRVKLIADTLSEWILGRTKYT